MSRSTSKKSEKKPEKRGARPLRKGDYVYRLTVDPERLESRDTLSGAIVSILSANGGRLTRKRLLEKFSNKIRNNWPKAVGRERLMLSINQRRLQDEGILQIIDTEGNVVAPRTQREWVK